MEIWEIVEIERPFLKPRKWPVLAAQVIEPCDKTLNVSPYQHFLSTHTLHRRTRQDAERSALNFFT